MKRNLLPLFFFFAYQMSFAQNVGIGTTIPQSQLQVSSANGNNLMLENTNTLANGTSTGIYFGNNLAGPGVYKYTGAIKSIGGGINIARLGFFTYATNAPSSLVENLTIIDNGNVGIGKTAPAQKLDVNGNASLSGNLTVQGGKGIISNTDGTQLKYHSFTVNINGSIPADGYLDWYIGQIAVGFTAPPKVYIGDVTNGQGSWYKVSLSPFNVDTNEMNIRIYNTGSAGATFSGTWAIMCIGN